MLSPTPKSARRSTNADGLFKAIADPSRRMILDLLATRDLPLNRIEERFRISRPAIIKHMRVLKSAGLVKTRRQGRQTIHRLNSPPLREVKDWVSHFELFWDQSLARLKQHIEENI